MKKSILLLSFLISFSAFSLAGNIQVVNNSHKQIRYSFTFNDTEHPTMPGLYVVEYSGTGIVYQYTDQFDLETPNSYGNYYFSVPYGGFFCGVSGAAITGDVTMNVYINGQLYEEGNSGDLTYQMTSSDTILIEFI